MTEKPIAEPVVKGVIEYEAKLVTEIDQTDKAIAKAKEDLIAREALSASMKSELEEVRAFLKVHAPKRDVADDKLMTWILSTHAVESQKGVSTYAKRVIDASARSTRVHDWLTAFESLPKISSTPKKAIVLEVAMGMLGGGKRVQTVEIVEKLKALNIDLEVANPQTRVSQILSEDDRFVTARGLGWWLKGEDPAGTGSSNATSP